MTVTGHWVETVGNPWKMRSVVLCFYEMGDVKSGEGQEPLLRRHLQEVGVKYENVSFTDVYLFKMFVNIFLDRCHNYGLGGLQLDVDENDSRSWWFWQESVAEVHGSCPSQFCEGRFNVLKRSASRYSSMVYSRKRNH